MKKINKILTILSILIALIYTISFKELTQITILQLLTFSIVLLIPLKINYNLKFIYILFIIFAYLLGVILKLYDRIYWYDSLVHFLYGIITSIVAVVILDRYKIKNIVFNILFITLTTFALAVIWELIEFSLDNIFSLDIQKVKETGVNDTMKDVICAFLGSLLFNLYYVRNKNLISSFVEQK